MNALKLFRSIQRRLRFPRQAMTLPTSMVLAVLFFKAQLLAQTGVQFWPYWGDGQAEVSSYAVTVPRYGAVRHGYDVLIFVTEDFDPLRQVKVEQKTDTSMPVMKLNHVRRFQTGVYDYAIMLSVFSPLAVSDFPKDGARAVTPLKTSLSASEWCGNYYEQINARSDGFHRIFHSYFESESDGETHMPYHRDLIFEDDLLIRMRELVSSFPAGDYRLINSSMYSRLQGFESKVVNVAVTRSILPDQSTPFGIAPVIQYTVSFPDTRRTLAVDVLGKGGKQILGWKRTFPVDGINQTETATLHVSQRMPYWKLQGDTGKEARQQLGLPDTFAVSGAARSQN